MSTDFKTLFVHFRRNAKIMKIKKNKIGRKISSRFARMLVCFMIFCFDLIIAQQQATPSNSTFYDKNNSTLSVSENYIELGTFIKKDPIAENKTNDEHKKSFEQATIYFAEGSFIYVAKNSLDAKIVKIKPLNNHVKTAKVFTKQKKKHEKIATKNTIQKAKKSDLFLNSTKSASNFYNSKQSEIIAISISSSNYSSKKSISTVNGLTTKRIFKFSLSNLYNQRLNALKSWMFLKHYFIRPPPLIL
ncbi:hypothetical protein SAMN05421847_0459 [Halpernia humi]|uniref:Uncharacterized protein n=1 Tax=Halpernia humi TaxID=493375 RepID=A0A1H5TFS2_9FLAO|nr:hypothetical protein [Halpernia humi]SEF61614.1 hypothetical protein SAMN05421847_0459 [Halpernia humi]